MEAIKQSLAQVTDSVLFEEVAVWSIVGSVYVVFIGVMLQKLVFE
jgi:hypothetical protein